MTENDSDLDTISIVIIGRGGMGAVTACEIIAEAAYLSGNFVDVQAYPTFGTERRGTPVQAYAKLSRKEKIWDRAQIEHPNIIIVLDETVLNQVIASSLEKNGIFIINSDKEPKFFAEKFSLPKNIKIIVADINKLALERGLIIDGAPMVNTPILGLLTRSISELNLDNINKVVQKRMSDKMAKLNIELIQEGFNLAKTL
jgi:2-oxoacid:acceptor oxidoreductase gamma subunit (pyruvate/2-ketoisovalerate family)